MAEVVVLSMGNVIEDSPGARRGPRRSLKYNYGNFVENNKYCQNLRFQ